MPDEDLYTLFVNLEEGEVLSMVKERLNQGEDPNSILKECREAVITIGQKFETGEYFLNDLIVAGEIFKEISDILEPEIRNGDEMEEGMGSIVIGTVKGDVHNIGKNIQISMLEGNGFKVHDLGVDVPPEKFIQKVKDKNPDILGLSCLLTTSWESLEETIKMVEDEDLRSNLKIVLGGAMVNDEIAEKVNADFWTDNAQEGVKICKKIVQGIDCGRSG